MEINRIETRDLAAASGYAATASAAAVRLTPYAASAIKFQARFATKK
jgi:hypothetical protein